jgi:hypothetical protein
MCTPVNSGSNGWGGKRALLPEKCSLPDHHLLLVQSIQTSGSRDCACDMTMTMEPLFAALAEAVFSSLLQESGLAERTRAALGLDPTRRAFQTALARAYTVFARHYPEWTTTLFDQPFLTSPTVVPLLAELLTRRGQPDPAHLARLFAAHLGHPDPDRWERLGDATRAAADFLTLAGGRTGTPGRSATPLRQPCAGAHCRTHRGHSPGARSAGAQPANGSRPRSPAAGAARWSDHAGDRQSRRGSR